MSKYTGYVWKLNDTDYAVVLIQERLKQLCLYPKELKCSGYYDESTKKSVILFQRKAFPIPRGLNTVQTRLWKARYWDGIVGPLTWRAMWPKTSFQNHILEEFTTNIKNKIMIREHSCWTLRQEDKQRKYGNNPKEVKDNLVKIMFLDNEIEVHKLHKQQFINVDKRIRKYEAKNNIDKYVPTEISTYNWRLIRGANKLSNHCFGAAIDIDWTNNPMTKSIEEINAYTKSNNKIPNYVIKCFEKEGARWGGKFISRKDFMHFEF